MRNWILSTCMALVLPGFAFAQQSPAARASANRLLDSEESGCI